MEYRSNLADETAHLESLLQIVSQSLALLTQKKEQTDEDLLELYRLYNTTADPHEGASILNDINIQGDQQEQYAKMLRNYTLALDKPYFGKIVFDVTASGEHLRIYIGKHGIYDYQNSSRMLVVDWRAPVSELYYNSGLGESGYTSPSGYIPVNVRLKTTLDISGGKLLGLYDSEAVTNDELLIKYLSRNKDVVLSDIVATIQADQNKIIRLPHYHNVIVQGVAGSGKTTVALHRIAYLLYNCPDLNSKNIYVIASSKLFLNYITSMLPDLDVPEISQGTLGNFLVEMIREFDPSFHCSLIPDSYTYSSEELADIPAKVAQHFKVLETTFYDENAMVEAIDFTLMNRGDVQLYLEAYRNKTLLERAELLDQTLTDRLKELRGSITSYILAHKKEPEMQASCEKIFGFKDGLIFESELERRFSRLVSRYKNYFTKKLKDINYLAVFEELRQTFWPNRIYAPLSRKKGAEHPLTLQDLALLLLVINQLKPTFSAANIRQIVIDEAQDFNLLIYSCLATVFSKATFTLVGDVMQNIAPNGLNSWDEVIRSVFHNEAEFRTLSKSYRNTIEISCFAAGLVSKYSTEPLYIEPVIRHGRPVCFYPDPPKNKRAEFIRQILAEKRENGEQPYQLTAVICKDDKTADLLYQQLQNCPDCRRLNPEEESLKSGTYLLSLKDSKGLEFDRVILPDFDNYRLETNRHDLKHVYVAITRALHELHLFTNQSEILQISESLR